jgi:hypothetical protein
MTDEQEARVALLAQFLDDCGGPLTLACTSQRMRICKGHARNTNAPERKSPTHISISSSNGPLRFVAIYFYEAVLGAELNTRCVAGVSVLQYLPAVQKLAPHV